MGFINPDGQNIKYQFEKKKVGEEADTLLKLADKIIERQGWLSNGLRLAAVKGPKDKFTREVIARDIARVNGISYAAKVEVGQKIDIADMNDKYKFKYAKAFTGKPSTVSNSTPSKPERIDNKPAEQISPKGAAEIVNYLKSESGYFPSAALEDGKLDANTIKKLNDLISLAESNGGRPVFWKGLQKILMKAGYYDGDIDGKAGPLTQDAIKKIIKDNGGTVLNIPIAKPQVSSTAGNKSSEGRTTQSTATQMVEYLKTNSRFFPNAGLDNGYLNKATINKLYDVIRLAEARAGSFEFWKGLQTILQKAGHYEGIDGIPGAGTRNAIREMISDNITVKAGEGKIRNAKLRVNLSNFTLAVIVGGQVKYTAPANNPRDLYRVATGKPSSPTTPRTTYIEEIITRPEELEQISRDNQFGGEPVYGEAMLNLANTGQEMHGTFAENSIGQNASKGCIRMSNETMALIMPFMREGSNGTEIEVVT